MVRRREFNAAFVSALVAAMPAVSKAAASTRTALYHVSVGRRLLGYRVDNDTHRLVHLAGTAAAPEEIQFGWSHPTLDRLYIASSDQNTTRQGRHFLSVFSIGLDGVPSSSGDSIRLDARPIHITVDRAGRYLFVAYNRPSGITVHRLADDGSIADTVSQTADPETGVYPHQVRVMPSNTAVLVVARGNNQSDTAAEEAGSLRTFELVDGQLGNTQVVAPDGGLGFRPRHADFSPSGEWAYIALESQNALQTYRISANRLSERPLYTASTLDPARAAQPGQLTSAIRVHPDGTYVYVANRGTGTEELPDGRPVAIGENTVAVFAIDPISGEPRLVQRALTGKVHARTMDISGCGEWLVAGSIRPALIRDEGAVASAAAGLSLFRIGPDGRLSCSHKLDLDTADGPVFWVGAWR